ncbi:MAG: helix-turn-helix domain-containing protein [Novosphingobium sp.]
MATTTRRMGPSTSATSTALLDAAERVLRNEGYGAASSRRIAEEAGVKQQLVYYYFQTMDELLLACFRRRTERALVRLELDAASEHPVRAIWKTLSNASDGKLSFEFMALANHHDGVRAEVARFVSESRRIEARAIARVQAGPGSDDGPVTPPTIAFLLSSVALMLGREAATGIDEGHQDVRALIEWALAKFD